MEHSKIISGKKMPKSSFPQLGWSKGLPKEAEKATSDEIIDAFQHGIERGKEMAIKEMKAQLEEAANKEATVVMKTVEKLADYLISAGIPVEFITLRAGIGAMEGMVLVNNDYYLGEDFVSVFGILNEFESQAASQGSNLFFQVAPLKDNVVSNLAASGFLATLKIVRA